ncbi:MAG: biopolymer transporter ExbD [Alphaproteobacteria bacterium]|nr:biopolymer transporter ExbD [Alphaproteobacteria bacterium]MBO6628980.1 biopolymer transporter ExbD [Alphaproteobacteria bacterium]|tara:strand:- start:256 stop:660 length:405 start_codon:yes stop_codon:yes gene_type:complete
MFDAPVHKKRIVSLTPLIDVVFLLLIFFMLASSFLQTQSIAVLTPAPNPEEVETDRHVVEVWIMNDGSFRLDGDPVTPDMLADGIRRNLGGDPEAVVSILAEKQAAVQPLISAMEAARSAGAQSIGTSRVEALR